MKLIALHGFKNNAKELIEFAPGHDPLAENADKWLHPDGVHKGARFSIGGDKKPAEMKNMQKHMDLIRELSTAQVIGDASDADLCKRVDEEVVADKAKVEENRKLKAAGSNDALIEQAVKVALSAILAAGWTPPATPKAATAAAVKATA